MAVSGSTSSSTVEEPEIARLNRELGEALEQQTATAEVLHLMSGSHGDLARVFDTILENATRLCQANFGLMHLNEGDAFRTVAMHNAPPAFAKLRRREPVIRARPLLRMAATKQLIHITDITKDEVSEQGDPDVAAFIELTGVRTLLGIPMLKDDNVIGAIVFYRTEVRPFTDKQTELLKNFAAQAAIAIENTRLLNELRQRTTDLTEALEQQTATSNVLQVISSSPGNLEPVFATMLENAVRLCDAKFGTINRWDGEALHLVATYNVPHAFAEFRSHTPFRPGPENPISRMLMTRTVIHFRDLATEQGYIERNPTFVAAVEFGGVRTFLAVPMLKENELIGVVIVYRQEVRPFSDKQIEVARNFAAQAVIAIENARLLNELRQRTEDLGQRTTDLTEALEQQTATSEVLQVISSSPGDLEPVFAAMLGSATRICEAKFGNLFLREEDAFRAVAWHGEPMYVNTWRGPALTIKTDMADLPLARVAATKQRVHVADLRQEAAYKAGHEQLAALVDKGGARTLLIVPMLKEQTLVGAITLYRQEVRPFSAKQIALVESFAAQAVIAIENARLLRELRERTEDVVKLNEQLEQRVSDQVGEIERMGRLRRFLPPQVADLIVASGTEKQLESHRREITALFCDLRGFTGFSESADPEDVMTVLREYHEALGASIIKYSGTLERYAGDGVMVVFNDPVPVENPALQAVLMALEMRDAIGALTSKWRRWGHEIGFGIGIAHGYATLGTIGFEGRFDYAAIGTVSNVASRLCDEAKPGQILISPRVLAAVEDAVKVEPVGEFELKGIRRPLAAYNVVGATSPQN
jgi:class 3 adenylate cyclase/putative methionine-R-sulfoxide reductase with GAF domain